MIKFFCSFLGIQRLVLCDFCGCVQLVFSCCVVVCCLAISLLLLLLFYVIYTPSLVGLTALTMFVPIVFLILSPCFIAGFCLILVPACCFICCLPVCGCWACTGCCSGIRDASMDLLFSFLTSKKFLITSKKKSNYCFGIF